MGRTLEVRNRQRDVLVNCAAIIEYVQVGSAGSEKKALFNQTQVEPPNTLLRRYLFASL